MFRYRLDIIVELRGRRTIFDFYYDELDDALKEITFWKNVNGYIEAYVYELLRRF